MISILAVACASCSSRLIANFGAMEIDPATLKVELKNELPLLDAPKSDYYVRFRHSDGRYSVDHFATGQKIRYDFFFVNADNSLITRTKYQVLLSGSFGTVYAQTTYFYAAAYAGQGTEFFTAPYSNDVGHEPFQLINALPSSEKLTLSAISVIRIFRAAPDFLIVSANYAPDGHLESFHLNGSEKGNWVHSNVVHSLYPELEVATMIGDGPKTRERFGIPVAFPLQQYLHEKSHPFKAVIFKSVMDTVNLHYDRNHYVRQDTFLPNGAIQTRYLTYRLTSEDKLLAPIDTLPSFGQFPWTRDPASR
jgi:hypothetical protein